MKVRRFLSAFLPASIQPSENTDKQMVIIHDRTNFSKTACSKMCILTFKYCTCMRTNILSSFSCLWTLAQRGKRFLIKVTPLSTSVKETQWDPGKEQWWCSLVKTHAAALLWQWKRKAFIVSGRCFSHCFMEMPFCFKFFVLDKQKD